MNNMLDSITSLTLPRLISDHMVLQRDSKVRIWGYAPSGESITLQFMNQEYSTFADMNSHWEIHLHNLPIGGPYTMNISTKHAGAIDINDIVIGDIYLCAGQSNMHHTMSTLLPLYEKEVAQCTNPMIRHFKVPEDYSIGLEKVDFSQGNWATATPESILDFTGVGYFFAQDIYEHHCVPLGLINTSQGGSPCESWINEEDLKAFPTPTKNLQPYKDPAFLENAIAENQEAMNIWYTMLHQKDLGQQEGKTPWYDNHITLDDWSETTLPGYLNESVLGDFIGIVWLKKTISIPEHLLKQPSTLVLGTIIDAETVYINGTCIGQTHYLYPRRRYQVPADLLKAGDNIITIRLISNNGICGFIPDKDYQFEFDTETISVSGKWNYKVSLQLSTPKPPDFFPQWIETALYNSMIAPLTPFSIKGILWYQGESNETRWNEYSALFATLIEGFRNAFDQGDLPFYYVQLPNLGTPSDVPLNEDWAYIRQAQSSALSIPNTGMAVTYDVGEWNDLHPLDKKTVGYRLSLLARKYIYGEHIVCSGPQLNDIIIEDSNIVLTFDHAESGLSTSDNQPLKHLFIKDKQGNYTPANASFHNNKLLIHCAEIQEITDIYYGWASNPHGANLSNQEGLLASPFHRCLS